MTPDPPAATVDGAATAGRSSGDRGDRSVTADASPAVADRPGARGSAAAADRPAAPHPLLRRPMRADARRNYERVLAAAREAFAEGGEATALEDIARRAGVGIGTLYRHFPNRQALLEALYLNEVEEVCRLAPERDGADAWSALNAWFERLIGYLLTKRALTSELLNYLDQDAPLFSTCRASLYAAGQPLLERAQAAGVVRADVTFPEVMQMVIGIAKVPTGDRAQTEHVLRIALDGLRHHPD